VIVIVGGGITGLAAAYELATRNVPFLLLESSDRIGGLVRTEHIDGCTIDCGADSMLVQKPAAIELCRQLGLESRLIPSTPPRTAFVYANDHLHPLPSPSLFGIPNTWIGLAHFDLLSPSARVRLALGLLPTARTTISADADDESVASFFRRRFGRDAVELIADPLIGGIHAGDVERLSIKSAAPRLLSEDLRLNLASLPPERPRATSSSTEPLTPRAEFRSLVGGMGELVSAIERTLPAGSIRIRSGALELSRADDPRSAPRSTSSGQASSAWRVTSAGGTVDADAVIIAAPAYVAARLCGALDPKLADLCNATRYVSTASVTLAWPKSTVPHPLDGSGFVVARRHSRLRITACTWVSSKWSHRAPAGTALLRAFLGGAMDPKILSLSDDELISVAVNDLSIALGVSPTPRFARVTRWPNAGAQHDVGHQSRVAQIEGRLAQLPGIFVAGSGFRSIGIPDCIVDGRAAAKASAHYAKIAS
jgi:protoporphyrinogen/coproporphyrinogen III oxidase